MTKLPEQGCQYNQFLKISSWGLGIVLRGPRNPPLQGHFAHKKPSTNPELP